MALTEMARDAERERIARHVLDLVKERGSEVPWTVAMAESGLTRARFEALFVDYDDLFDAVAQTWLAPQLAVMEEVLSSSLPPQRKMFEFFRRRFVIAQGRFREDPQFFTVLCEMGAANFERVRSYVDLADHYLCELIAEAQAEGFFAGLEIDERDIGDNLVHGRLDAHQPARDDRLVPRDPRKPDEGREEPAEKAFEGQRRAEQVRQHGIEHDVEERNQLEALAARKHVTTQCQLDVRSLQPFATGRVDRLRAAERVGGEQTRVVDVPRSKPPLVLAL